MTGGFVPGRGAPGRPVRRAVPRSAPPGVPEPTLAAPSLASPPGAGAQVLHGAGTSWAVPPSAAASAATAPRPVGSLPVVPVGARPDPPPAPERTAPGTDWVHGAEERMAAQVARAHDRALALETLRDDVAALRGAARSPRGEVDVLVDSRGRLVQLRLGERAGALRPATLARLIEDTVAAAVATAERSVLALVEERCGVGSSLTAVVRADLSAAAS